MALLLTFVAGGSISAAPPSPRITATRPPSGTPPGLIALLTVTLPKNGDYWRIGETEGVYWNYNAAAGKRVNLWLVKGNLPVLKMVSNLDIENTVYHWPVPGSIVPAGDYRILIESVERPTVKAYSQGFFTVKKVMPGLTVMAPNGGQSWARGTTQTIGWVYAGKPGTTVVITLVRPGIPSLVIAQNVPIDQQFSNLGSFAWMVPVSLTPAADYKIQVQVTNTQYLDSSDQAFAIK